MSKKNNNQGTTNALKKIRSKWEPLWANIDKFNQDLAMFSANVLTVAQQIKSESLERSWNKLAANAEKFYNDLDGIITESQQIDKVTIKLPWDNQTFSDTWQLWTEYLLEQHNIIVGTRTQLIQLKQLEKLSNKDENKAIEIIEWSMINFYKTFYPVSEINKKQISKKRSNRKDDDFS